MAATRAGRSRYRIAATSVSRVIEIADGIPQTIEIATSPGAPIPVEGHELALVIDTATWRHDIPMWRWLEASDDDVPDEWHQPGFDDSAWRTVPTLHPVLTARAGAASWFRAWVTLPESLRGSPVSIVLGGLDGQDWRRYEAHLDGQPLASWTGSGPVREPRRTTIGRDAADHDLLRFGEPMLLAVRCEGLDRTHPRIVPGELEHHYFADWLLDQYVAIGEPTRTLRSFRVTDLRAGEGESWLEYDLACDDDPAVAATIRHASAGPVLRKTMTIHNRGREPLAILDVTTDELRGAFDASFGGRGQPVHIDGIFGGIEHPAGVAQADHGLMRLIEMPGTSIAPGASWQAQPGVLGGRDEQGVDSAFRSYISGLRARPEQQVRVYSALGWYDFTNPADPLPELTADLVDENLEQLAELRAAGAGFDVYMLDDWWDWEDLRRFRRGAFPDGHRPIARKIKDAGMRAGIWWATTRAVWSEKDARDVAGSWANDPGFGGNAELAGGDWRWLEEWTNLIIGERRFCLASEPYRRHYLEALPGLVADLDAQLIKLDCSVLHCTSSEHDHRAGRYSVQPMVDALVDLLEHCAAASDDLRVVWYWGFRSPWFLRFGDALFDKGLLMEAATVSSAPAPTIRQSLTTNVDEAIRHARTFPLRLQDSLGVWIGDVAWCNRIGTEEWREALLVDIARGADLLQLWGDLTMLTSDDRRQLGDIFRWLDRLDLPAGEALEIGGDPWAAEPYGYVREGRDGAIVTLVNPDWQHATVDLPELQPGWPTRPAVVELYPFPGRVPGVSSGPVSLELAPFEVRLLEVVEQKLVDPGVQDRERPIVRTTVELELPEDPAGGDIRLPEVHRGDVIFVMERLRRDGEWAYQPAPQSLVGLEATLDGLAVRSTTIPTGRDRNGPGSPWVLHRIPAGPAWSGRDLHVTFSRSLPTGLEMTSRALLVDAWWLRSRRTFRDLSGGRPASPAKHQHA